MKAGRASWENQIRYLKYRKPESTLIAFDKNQKPPRIAPREAFFNCVTNWIEFSGIDASRDFTIHTVYSSHSLLITQFTHHTVYSSHSLLITQFTHHTVYSSHSLLITQFTHHTVESFFR